MSEPGDGAHALALPDSSGAVPTSTEARAKRHIAALEEELQTMKQERGTKQRKTTYYVAQGRGVRRMSVLYTNLEDLIAENDRRYEEAILDDLEGSTLEQNRLQRGYLSLAQALPWFHSKLSDLDADDCEDMLKKIKRGADVARGDDTSTLKDLVATWVNQDFRPSPLLRSNDKQLRGFTHDVCGDLLCPAEWDWNDNRVKAGIRDRTSDFIVSENSWPRFVYENYLFDNSDLEKGLFKSKILVQAFKATFTSPSSAREADGDGDGADILENNRRARRALNQVKVKMCVASIINMKKVTPRSIAYIVCQVRFALSSVSSWRTVDGDFDYEGFWNNIVDFFEEVPGPVAQRRVSKLLKWWTRFSEKNHREDLTPEVVSQMSVTALAEQRKAQEDAAFDSD
ncbi:uncharacterized protein F5891DRAFT_1195992 [Suillus fuscotomentosus]|uniref:Uncharacterized protein n=1 Tax=Suillus fuscotomentosus TaxID=1912939 RepID=A0AAD4DTN8_9AGAM|nr:uncharacterized protein F5891DRAFT_1195992 [Suillus fuscotomentosus]KAG1893755.1 hypothetical protein F5891DRAFT_1195992 [Suillus fuscotomentosus]